jgi:hypothetical protein
MAVAPVRNIAAEKIADQNFPRAFKSMRMRGFHLLAPHSCGMMLKWRHHCNDKIREYQNESSSVGALSASLLTAPQDGSAVQERGTRRQSPLSFRLVRSHPALLMNDTCGKCVKFFAELG